MLASAPEIGHPTYAQARLRREIFTVADKDETTMATAERNFFTVVDGDNFAIRQFGMMIKLRRRIVCSVGDGVDKGIRESVGWHRVCDALSTCIVLCMLGACSGHASC